MKIVFLISICLVVWGCSDKSSNNKIDDEIKESEEVNNIKLNTKVNKISTNNQNNLIVGYWWIDSSLCKEKYLFKGAQAILFDKKGSFFLFKGGVDYGFEEYLGNYVYVNNELTFEFTEISNPVKLKLNSNLASKNLILSRLKKRELVLRKVERSELYK